MTAAVIEPFTFKHVRKGQPIQPSEVPKLPPAAVRLIRRKQAENKASGNPAKLPELLADLAIGIVATCLRRLEPGLSEQTVAEDEDHTEVLRFYHHIVAENPTVFPPEPEAAPNNG